jgi:hypothetical protein
MGCEISHDEELAWPELRPHHLPQKGKQDLAIAAAFDGHGGDQTLETQGPQHGDMAAPIAGLGGQGPLAPGGASVKMAHRLMAARFVKKDAIFRDEQLDGILERGPLPLDLGPLWLGGAKRLFLRGRPSLVKARLMVAWLTLT